MESIRKGTQESGTGNMTSGHNDDQRGVREVAQVREGGAPQGSVRKAPQVIPQVTAGECHLDEMGAQEAKGSEGQGGQQRGEQPHHGVVMTR